MKDLPRLIHPFRYSASITDATQCFLRRQKLQQEVQAIDKTSHYCHLQKIATKVTKEVPIQDVVDLVRSLFVRDLVDVRQCGCGYGDFLVWCGLETLPLDPLLFSAPCNYPEVNEQEVWDQDEVCEAEKEASY